MPEIQSQSTQDYLANAICDLLICKSYKVKPLRRRLFLILIILALEMPWNSGLLEVGGIALISRMQPATCNRFTLQVKKNPKTLLRVQQFRKTRQVLTLLICKQITTVSDLNDVRMFDHVSGNSRDNPKGEI